MSIYWIKGYIKKVFMYFVYTFVSNRVLFATKVLRHKEFFPRALVS